uniref:Uncharacterized protein n=1 Tax=Aegilops tauschii subsp. strangulata TaxID=200361 RepID=A0A452YN66_AEGTS
MSAALRSVPFREGRGDVTSPPSRLFARSRDQSNSRVETTLRISSSSQVLTT